MKGLPEAWSKESPPVMSNMSRPNSLFHSGLHGQPPNGSVGPSSVGGNQPASMGPQDLKDLYLQDLSDGMCYQFIL